MPTIPTHPSERFWDKVDKRGPDECWEWSGSRHPSGYGMLHAGQFYEANVHFVKAHRLSWEIAAGQPIPSDGCILHHCDNPPCVNPAHLYLGTRQENVRDRVARGRGHRQNGENNSNAKLTEANVVAIIAGLQRLPRQSQTAIAEQFGVKQAQVSRIMRRESWAHLWPDSTSRGG